MGPGRESLQVLEKENLTKYSWIQLVSTENFFSVLLYVRDYIFVIFIIGKDTG